MYAHFFKRIFDFTLALIAILCLSPLLIVVTIWLHFANKGAGAFFTQERPGKGEKIFKVIKYKSMTDERDEKGNLLPDEKRLTKIGNIIRKTSIDELPQLFNVFGGSMSMVGPRPERPEIMKQYKENVPEFYYRLKVKGGLTGYAQVYGKYNTTPYNKLRMDLIYIQNYSLWLDLKIIVQTVKILFEKENTEGIDQDQTTALREDQKNPDETQENESETRQ